ncbi:hypothetical protein MD484_g5252, partial [Candolleomyces efflorescens]
MSPEPEKSEKDASASPSSKKEGKASKSSSTTDLSDLKSPTTVITTKVKDDTLVDEDPTPFRWTNWLLRKPVQKYDPDAISTRRSVYDDPALAEYYWPKPDYENIHRSFSVWGRMWARTADELLVAQKLVRKIDWKVMLWAAISFSALNLDRGNLSQANTDNILPDLGMNTNGMDFTLHTSCEQIFIYMYTNADFNLGNTVFRLAFLSAELPSQLVSKRMPPGPTQTKTWYRPKGWFSDREEVIAVSRILRDDPSKGDMHNREALTLRLLWKAIIDYDLWPLYIIGLLFGIPATPPAQYLTLSLRNMGFSTFETNLLTIPAAVGTMISMYAIAVISETVNDRAFVSMAEDLWCLPFLIALRALPNNPNPWIFYGLATGLLVYPSTHPIQVGWCSRNAGGVASRTVNASLYNMFVQASGIISSNIYRRDDAPMYRRGNNWLIGVCAFNCFILYPGVKLYYLWRNKRRAAIWDKMSNEEKADYLKNTGDKGNQRLDFRFAH